MGDHGSSLFKPYNAISREGYSANPAINQDDQQLQINNSKDSPGTSIRDMNFAGDPWTSNGCAGSRFIIDDDGKLIIDEEPLNEVSIPSSSNYSSPSLAGSRKHEGDHGVHHDIDRRTRPIIDTALTTTKHGGDGAVKISSSLLNCMSLKYGANSCFHDDVEHGEAFQQRPTWRSALSRNGARLWSLEEMHSLIRAADRCFCESKAVWAHVSMRWTTVLKYMREDGHERTEKKAMCKFWCLHRSFKTIRDWKAMHEGKLSHQKEMNTRMMASTSMSSDESYESMTPNQRQQCGLPRSFDKTLYDGFQRLFDHGALDNYSNSQPIDRKLKAKKGLKPKSKRRKKRFFVGDGDSDDTDDEDEEDDEDNDDNDDDANDDDDYNEEERDHKEEEEVGLSTSCKGLEEDERQAEACGFAKKQHLTRFQFRHKNNASLPNLMQKGHNGGRGSSSNNAADSDDEDDSDGFAEDKRIQAKKRKKIKRKEFNEILLHHIQSTSRMLSHYIQAVKMNIETANLLLTRSRSS